MYNVRKQVTDGIERIVLPNGLALTLRGDARVPVAAARFYVRGGSVSEQLPGGRGIAHLLEHLIATAAAAEMERRGDGALLNAYTTQDYTCFHWSALADDVVSSVRGFFAGLRRVASLALDLDAEKSVILQEIGLFREKRLASFQQSFLEEMFEVHPLRYPVCGYPNLLRDVSLDEVAAYLAQLYTGANLRLVIAGDIDEPSIIDAVEEACGAIDEGHRFTLHVEEPRRAREHSFDVEAAGVHGAYTQIGVRFGGGFDDAVAFAALAQTVNASSGCRLRRDLVEPHVVRDLAARSVTSAFGAGYFYVLTEHDAGAAAEDAVRRWLADVAAGRADLPLDVVRRAAAQDDEPTLDAWTALLGQGDVRSEQPLENWRFNARLHTIEEDDVRGAVARHLDAGNLTIGRLHDRIERPSAPAAPRHTPAASYEESLPNGVRLLILPTPSAIASCQVLWCGGVLAETDQTNGLSSLTARLLPVSLPASMRSELRAYQDATDAELFAFSDENVSGISLTVGARDLEAGLRFLATAAVEPSFEGEAVEQERERTASWVSAPAAAWLPELLAQLKQLLYRKHPFRLPDIGRPESLRALTLADVAECHRRMCVGSNTVVVISGRVTPIDLRESLASLFSPVAEGRFAPETASKESEDPGTLVVARPRGFGALAFGYRGIAWEPRTWGALELVKALLSGPENNSVRGRLQRAMREDGTAYSVHCYNQAGWEEGYFSIMTAFAPEKEEQAAAIVAREIERLRAGDIAQAELSHCRKLYLLQHLKQYESPRLHACLAGRHMLFSSEPASWTRSVEELGEIDVDEIAAVARRTFRDANRGLVLFRSRGD